MTESAARRTEPSVPSMDHQQSFWDDWNSAYREESRTEISLRQARVVLDWLVRDGRRDLRILEVGCGSSWFSAPVLQGRCRVPPPDPGQVRRWVDRRELRALTAPHFLVPVGRTLRSDSRRATGAGR